MKSRGEIETNFATNQTVKKLKMGKIVFYCLLGGMGHLNIPQAISKRIFQLYGDQHEVYFLVNKGNFINLCWLVRMTCKLKKRLFSGQQRIRRKIAKK